MAKNEDKVAFGLSAKQLGVFAVILLVGAYMTNFSGFADQVDKFVQDDTGAQVNQDQTSDSSVDQGDSQADQGQDSGDVTQKPIYQVATVKHEVKDKLDKASGISSVEVEVFPVPSGRYSESDLIAIASDPDRDPLDEDTNTSSDGTAEFSNGKVNTNTPYLYSLRGDGTIYDKVITRTVKTNIKDFSISPFSFPDPVYAYKVGSFGDIDADGINQGDNTYDAEQDSGMNITTSSGSTYVTTSITIEEGDTGKALKEPVLVLRSTADQELETGDVESLYLTRKQGTDLGISGTDLTNYIDSGRAIKLDGSLYDEETHTTLMGIQDSGVYTVKMTFDAAQIQPSGDQFEIVLDDLSEYKGRDDTTGNTKAAAETLTFNWQN